MFEREKSQEQCMCPQCGKELHVDGDVLVCEEHGNFFAYGPRLLVRAPNTPSRDRTPAMPWEMNLKRKHA
jgi:hypothetical protein